MKKYYFLLILFSLSLFSQETWKINPDHSEIIFEIPYLGLAKTTGRFSRFTGYLKVKDKALESLKIQIEADSIYTGNKLRDAHLRKPDFFHTKKYPFILFTSSEIKEVSSQQYRATGTMRIKDVSKEFEIIFKITPKVKDSWGKFSQFAIFNTQIDRKSFNLKWSKKILNNNLLVGEKVNVSGSLQLQPVNAMTLKSKHLIPDSKQMRVREKISRSEKSINELSQISNINPLLKAPKKDIVEKSSSQSQQLTYREKDKTFVWWMSYITLALLGMIAVIFLSYFGKKNFSRVDESESKSFIGDLIIIFPLGLIYAMSLWYLGFN